MNYKYITDNNLEHVQTYMYSEYGGIDFLQSYYESRRGHVTPNILYNKNVVINKIRGYANSESSVELFNIWDELNESTCGMLKSMVDKYVKRFEFRKRIYEKYEFGKADLESRYDDIPVYVIMGGGNGNVWIYP